MKTAIECLEELSQEYYRCSHYDLEFKSDKEMELFFKDVIKTYHNQK